MQQPRPAPPVVWARRPIRFLETRILLQHHPSRPQELLLLPHQLPHRHQTSPLFLSRWLGCGLCGFGFWWVIRWRSPVCLGLWVWIWRWWCCWILGGGSGCYAVGEFFFYFFIFYFLWEGVKGVLKILYLLINWVLETQFPGELHVEKMLH